MMKERAYIGVLEVSFNTGSTAERFSRKIKRFRFEPEIQPPLTHDQLLEQLQASYGGATLIIPEDAGEATEAISREYFGELRVMSRENTEKGMEGILKIDNFHEIYGYPYPLSEGNLIVTAEEADKAESRKGKHYNLTVFLQKGEDREPVFKTDVRARSSHAALDQAPFRLVTSEEGRKLLYDADSVSRLEIKKGLFKRRTVSTKPSLIQLG